MSPHSAARRAAAALAYRDFRVLWTGACISSIGTWMQKVAQSWLVLTLTGSPFYLGLDAFLGEMPILLLVLVGGVVADRRDRRRVLLVSQYVQMSTAFALAILVHTDVVRIWHVLALSCITGTAQAFGSPAYQSLMPMLVRRHDVPNAIALNSIQFNLARIVGPLAAGVALAAFGSAACFAINGLSFLVVVASLLMLRVRIAPAAAVRSVGEELRGGLAFVRRHAAIRAFMFLAFCTALLGSPVLTLLPVVVQRVFQQDAAGFSRMMAFSGAGSVVGAIVVAWLGRFSAMARTAVRLQAFLGVLLVAFAASRVLALSYGLLFLGSLAMMMVFSLLTSLVQLEAPDQMRGRVMSIYTMAFRGGAPLGSIAAGALAARTSAPAALAATGALLTLIVGAFAWRSASHWEPAPPVPDGDGQSGGSQTQ
ncbi:MAG TPA: MFS transporter [Vicinamibacterales bacterium]|nr:MFS transporter [Vicinamibacterales bacterium]HPW19949.1 MFS transporter [Vicinamibacterales bacterium]